MKKSGKNHFIKLNEQFGQIIEMSFKSGHETKLSELLQFVDDLSLWVDLLKERVDTTILISATKEYELGFQAVVSGQYRYAFIAHRYFLEQLCRFIYLSTNELYLRQWKMGVRDISWQSLVDKESGIFSKAFIRAFYFEVDAEGDHMINLVSTLYRESSEFIHGNFDKIEALPSNIEFKSELLKKWLEFIETSKFVSIFLLFMRFSRDLEKKEVLKIEDMAKEELGGIEEFNLLFIF